MSRILVVLLIAFVLVHSLFAIAPQGTAPVFPQIRPSLPGNSLDLTCNIQFVHFTYGTQQISIQFPGDGGFFYFTGFAFINSCTPGETLYTYCSDVNHPLQTNPYCVNIDSMQVRQLYPEQAPAMAYVMSQYPVLNALDDEIMQLTIWKMSNDNRNAPTNGEPFYHINALRGYPNISDPPVYPYVNTVYSSNASVNDPANLRVLDALGYGSDGLQKNVVMCDDQLDVTRTPAVLTADSGFVTVTLTLTRGASASVVHNLLRSGIRFVITAANGALSAGQVFTNANGQAQFVVGQALGSPTGADVRICSYGLWPTIIEPCEGGSGQQLTVQTLTEGALCSLCVNIHIPPDEFLPVELTSFEALSGVHGVDLLWHTASETNQQSWEVQRRTAAETNFQPITTLPAVNAAEGHSYQFTDASVTTGSRYDYRLVDVSINGTRTVHNNMVRSVVWNTTGVLTGFALAEAYPNPFNPGTVLRFSLPETQQARLVIYDLKGRQVKVLAEGLLSAGEHRVTFDGSALATGVYFARLEAGKNIKTQKLMLLK